MNLLPILDWWHSYFVISVGSFRGSQNKMCWIPYLQEFFRIFNSLPYPGTRGLENGVSITLIFLFQYSHIHISLYLIGYSGFHGFMGSVPSSDLNACIVRCPESEACKKILEKMGLTGYQVIGTGCVSIT